ncbi:signal peptidase I [Streptomyces sp. NPDC127084]|uniref:signal peptidase I n=1 Tax=Streptomyces sp. NPDC127084 TaxID=3347133 RepID=UPI003669FE06
MDTDVQHTERDRSSAQGTDDSPPEARSRSARISTRASGFLRRLSLRRAAGLGVIAGVLLLLLSHFVVQPFLIPSTSMEPGLQVGDRVVVNKLAYRFGSQPQRGDVVVFDGTGSFVQEAADRSVFAGLVRGTAAALGLAEPAETDFVKRVIGVGGDRVKCCGRGGRLEVNGVAVDEYYVHPDDAPSRVPFDVVVPEGTLFVLGDHRDKSRDSRDHLGDPGGGMVPLDKVIGRADWIGWPAGRWSTVQPPTMTFYSVPAPGGAHG